MKIDKELILCDGKYRFYLTPAGNLYCDRNEEFWRSFIGDKAITSLFNLAFNLKEIHGVAPSEKY